MPSTQTPISQESQPNSHDPQPSQVEAGAKPSQVAEKAFSPLNLSSQDWQYEDAVAKVEAIIAQIEAGELELADIFEQFAIAMQNLQDCEAFLKHHRQQVDLLVETLIDESER